MKSPYSKWTFDATSTRLPEFAAPGIGRESNRISIDVDVAADSSGVLYALGGVAGGLSLYMDNGVLVYEYNMMMIERTIARSTAPLAPGRRRIEVDTSIGKPGGPADVVIKVDGAEVMQGPGSRARCPPRSLPAKPSMSALISARPFHSIISSGARSGSMGASPIWTSNCVSSEITNGCAFTA